MHTSKVACGCGSREVVVSHHHYYETFNSKNTMYNDLGIIAVSHEKSDRTVTCGACGQPYDEEKANLIVRAIMKIRG